jgi:hypothetical protein
MFRAPIITAEEDPRPRKVRRNIYSCVECEFSITLNSEQWPVDHFRQTTEGSVSAERQERSSLCRLP